MVFGHWAISLNKLAVNFLVPPKKLKKHMHGLLMTNLFVWGCCIPAPTLFVSLNGFPLGRSCGHRVVESVTVGDCQVPKNATSHGAHYGRLCVSLRVEGDPILSRMSRDGS